MAEAVDEVQLSQVLGKALTLFLHGTKPVIPGCHSIMRQDLARLTLSCLSSEGPFGWSQVGQEFRIHLTHYPQVKVLDVNQAYGYQWQLQSLAQVRGQPRCQAKLTYWSKTRRLFIGSGAMDVDTLMRTV